ncbi:glycoside hydrolase family 5 protein [Bradyrhizobium sp.]|uniref:glycoside hydrolase family 5 protein n=1 Tax=Bradyrhizobium sp. TaxID=376 RepID=UPI0040378FCC
MAARPALAIAASLLVLWTGSAQACQTLLPGVAPDRIAALSRGFNADGWINGAQLPPPRALLTTLRKAGMSHVRLPVPAEQIMQRFAAPAEREARLRAVDAALKALLGSGYAVSIDLHPGNRFNALHREDAAASMQAMQDAWAALANVIKSFPADRVFAELLNEPDVDAARWQSEVETLAAFVRQLLPRTTLIVGPVNWQRADSLPDFRPLDDSNVVYAIHFYDPMAFTHQAHWDRNDPLHHIRDLPYPAKADDPSVQGLKQQLSDGGRTRALAILEDATAGSTIGTWLEPAVAWQQRHARPIIINEFGVLKAGAPRESRLRWLADVTAHARQHCWGWTHWELSQGFGFADAASGKVDVEALKALLGQR